MTALQWLDYFTEETSDVHIVVGKKVRASRRNPDFAQADAFVPFEDGTIIEVASEEKIGSGEFFYELSHLLSTKKQWERFFSKDGVNMAVSDGDNRYRVYAENGAKGKPYAIIRRIPQVIAFSPDK